jgi:type I restriction enzyme S subunit
MNRYQSYKPSRIEWIGEIPNEWSTKRLTYSFKIQKGKIPSELLDEPIVNGLPYLSMDVLRVNEPNEFSIDKNIVEVKDGDIGILWDGSNSGEIIKINRNGILSSTVSLLTIIDKGLNKQFGYYLLKLFENDFKSNTTGMGIPHVNGNYVRESKIIIPPLQEQIQIVQFLDEKNQLIDNLISIKERKIVLLKEQRISIINQLVTKGLNPNVKMKDCGVDWIGEIPDNWSVFKVSRFTKEHRQGYYSTDGYDNEGFRVVRITDLIENNKIIIENSPFYKLDKENEERYKLEKGDFLFQRTGSHKKIGVFNSNEPSVYGSFLIRFRFSNKINHHYLLHFFNSISYQNQLNEQIHGGVNPNIHVENIKVCYLTFPPLFEQSEIVKYLDFKTKEIDDLVQLEQKKIDLLKEYRQSLISEVVTGKFKVTQ